MRNRRRSTINLFENDVDSSIYICTSCFHDEFLKSAIKNWLTKECKVCKKTENPSISAELISKTIKSIIQQHFINSPECDTARRKFSLAQIIGNVIDCDDSEFCELIASSLSLQSTMKTGDFFSAGNEYNERRTEYKTELEREIHLIKQWDTIAIKLNHSQRYFNDDAERFFSSIFEEATQAKTNTLFGEKRTAVREFRAGLELFRARRLDNPTDKQKFLSNPNKELGAPPKEAAGDNRMNSAGVPLFYAAKDRATSIAEVRPSIGDDIATVKFKTTRDLILFDFRGFSAPWEHTKLSYFVDHYDERLNHRALLSYLHRLISQPVRAGGNKYIITQAMTDYLSRKHGEKFDGIIFNSVQEKNGVNYVIFSEKPIESDLQEPNWQPTFPVECTDKPYFHTVSTIKFGGDW